jgi:copper oxidase (laccase) domain-containing protein
VGVASRFTGRADGDLSDPEALSRAVAAMGLDPGRVALSEQIHGNVVRRVSAPGLSPGADALVTDVPDLALLVRGADCPLVLLTDAGESVLAVVHAGWRGILAGVLAAAREALEAPVARACLGPCAGPCCYEVGEEVATRFPAKAVRRGPETRPRLDLPLAAELSLGVPLDRERWRCTVCGGEHHSWRGQRTDARNGLIAALRSGAP